MFSLLLKRNSIRTRLVLWNTFTLALLFVAMDIVLHYSVRAILTGAIDRELHQRTQHIVDFPPSELIEGRHSFEELESERPHGFESGSGERFRRPPGFEDMAGIDSGDSRPRLISPQGNVIKPPDVHEPWDAISAHEALQKGQVYSTINYRGEALRLISRRFPGQGEVLGVIQTPMSLKPTDRVAGAVDNALLWLFPLTLVCAVLGSSLVTNRMLRQVQSFTSSANELSANDLSQRLPVTGQDEFSTLAQTFNAMLARLEAAFKKQEDLIGNLRQMIEQQRRFTADASHELQTPLTTIKANTSLYLSTSESDDLALEPQEYRAVLEDIDQAASSMTHLVSDLLLLARSDEGQLGKNRRIFLVNEAIENAVALAASGKQGIAHIQIKLPTEELHLWGNEAELTRLFTNLLSNAIRYTPESGHIVIRAERFDPQVRISVADTGIGIPEAALSHLGERFFRADAARSRAVGGTGLGLSICKSIVASHNGTLSFDSRVGEGTTVTVLLPLASA